jgi:hypothetical protein
MNTKKNGLERRIDELKAIIKGYEEGKLTKRQLMEIIKYNERNKKKIRIQYYYIP